MDYIKALLFGSVGAFLVMCFSVPLTIALFWSFGFIFG